MQLECSLKGRPSIIGFAKPIVPVYATVQCTRAAFFPSVRIRGSRSRRAYRVSRPWSVAFSSMHAILDGWPVCLMVRALNIMWYSARSAALSHFNSLRTSVTWLYFRRPLIWVGTELLTFWRRLSQNSHISVSQWLSNSWHSSQLTWEVIRPSAARGAPTASTGRPPLDMSCVGFTTALNRHTPVVATIPRCFDGSVAV